MPYLSLSDLKIIYALLINLIFVIMENDPKRRLMSRIGTNPGIIRIRSTIIAREALNRSINPSLNNPCCFFKIFG
jgi:hypothetical protein